MIEYLVLNCKAKVSSWIIFALTERRVRAVLTEFFQILLIRLKEYLELGWYNDSLLGFFRGKSITCKNCKS